MKTKESVAQNNKLLSLTPFLDAEGIIRVGGRLRNSPMSFDKIHPILLTAKHIYLASHNARTLQTITRGSSNRL